MTSLGEPVDLSARYDDVRARIQNAASGRNVTLIAVSKFQPLEKIEALYRLGHRDFGENYVQELVTKAAALRERGLSDIRWHLIGHLQSNKIKSVLPEIFSFHALDSLKLATKLQSSWEQLPQPKDPLSVFIQVNIDEEETKSGVPPHAVTELCARVAEFPGLHLEGLMCIPAPVPEQAHEASAASTKNAFERLRHLELKCRPHTRGALSMGMSEDFEEAIRAGATHVRIGSSLFGLRS